MKTNHLQSLIALNANRITRMHANHAQFIEHAKAFKNTEVVHPMYQQYVDSARSKAFSAASGITKDIARAVELQKELQAELRKNNAEAAANKPKKEITSLFYTHVMKDGSNGFCDGTFCVEEFSNGARICHHENGTSSEKYDGMGVFFSETFKRGASGIHQHTTRQYPKNFQAPGVYSIDNDGQPKNDGLYLVKYEHQKEGTDTLKFENGVWYTKSYVSGMYNENPSAFGNEDTRGESYTVQ